MKKVFFEGKEVNINEEIKLNHKVVKVTNALIEALPEMFIVLETFYVECVKWFHSRYKVGKIYEVRDGLLISIDESDSITFVKYGECSSNFVLSNKTDYDNQKLLSLARKKYPVGTKFFAISDYGNKDNHPSVVKENTQFYWDKTHSIITCSVFPGDVYVKETDTWAEIANDIPEYVKIKEDVEQGTTRWASNEPGKVYKVYSYSYYQPLKMRCYFVDRDCCIVPTDCVPASEEDFRDYLKRELEESAKKRYPIGSYIVSLVKPYAGIIKDYKFMLNSADQLWMSCNDCNLKVYDNGVWAEAKKILGTSSYGVTIYDGDTYFMVNAEYDIMKIKAGENTDISKLFATETSAELWIKENNPRRIEYYENILLLNDEEVKIPHDFTANLWELYYWLKLTEPKLYWKKVYQLIADDLNDGWKPDWNNYTQLKYNVYVYEDKYEISNCKFYNHGETYFKSADVTSKAVHLMGDNIKNLFR